MVLAEGVIMLPFFESMLMHYAMLQVDKVIKRADGHLRRVSAMIEEARLCVDIAQQLHAVEKAVCQAKRTLVHDHLDHCLGPHGGRHRRGRSCFARRVQTDRTVFVGRNHDRKECQPAS